MPLYDYRCSACGREVEVMHGINEGGPTACEACGGRMSKVLSPPAIHFKGSGWAKKDAATSAKKAKPKTDASGDAPTGSKSGTGGEDTAPSAAGSSSSGKDGAAPAASAKSD